VKSLLYDNYEEDNQGLVDKLHGSRDTLQDIIDQIDQNIESLPELRQASEEIESPARFPKLGPRINGSFLGPTPT
jgi:hypothetical protein